MRTRRFKDVAGDRLEVGGDYERLVLRAVCAVGGLSLVYTPAKVRKLRDALTAWLEEVGSDG